LIDKGFHRLFTIDPNYQTKLQAGIGPGTWTTSISDANLFDANEMPALGLSYDPRPTGSVFTDGLKLELGGIVNKAVPVTINGATVLVKPAETTAQLSVAGIDGFIRGRGTVAVPVTTLAPAAQAPKSLLDLYKGLPDSDVYSLKRAGDWGQVEHCARYGKIFVTADKLAALYAAYRNVGFIFVSQHVMNPYNQLPGFVQHTFVLGKSR